MFKLKSKYFYSLIFKHNFLLPFFKISSFKILNIKNYKFNNIQKNKAIQNLFFYKMFVSNFCEKF